MSNVDGLPPRVVELEDGEHYMYHKCEFCDRVVGIAWLSSEAWEGFMKYADFHLESNHPEMFDAHRGH